LFSFRGWGGVKITFPSNTTLADRIVGADLRVCPWANTWVRPYKNILSLGFLHYFLFFIESEKRKEKKRKQD